jgi:Tol biopolymer transport system component
MERRGPLVSGMIVLTTANPNAMTSVIKRCLVRRALSLGVLSAACGRAAVSGGTPAEPAPMEWSAWSIPQNVGPVINSAANEEQPAISNDDLSLYFLSDRPGGLGRLDIWVSRRRTPSSPWQAPVNLGPNINSPADERGPAFSRDEKQLYFNSAGRGGCGGSDIFVATRDSLDDLAWRRGVNLGCVINSTANDADVSLFDDPATGTTSLYFASNRARGVGDFDIYLSTRAKGESAFEPPSLVRELSGRGRDTRTAIRRDGLELILSSDTAARVGGIGGQDLWVSTRPNTRAPWSPPINLGATVNSAEFDGAPSLSVDGSTLYFHSSRPGGFGGSDIYVTTRRRIH